MHQREKGRQTMEKLTDLPNIGPKLAENLEKAGIETPDQLRELGAETAFLRIRTQVDSTACLPAGSPGGSGGGCTQEPAASGAQDEVEGLVSQFVIADKTAIRQREEVCLWVRCCNRQETPVRFRQALCVSSGVMFRSA